MRTILLASALVLVAGPAFAQRGTVVASGLNAPGVQGPAERFKAADKDSDGKVTRPEFLATLNPDAKPYISAIWRNRDRNGDGWLTQEEMTTNGDVGLRGRAPAPAPAATAATAAR